MLKPSSLRAHLTAAVPDLARDPENLLLLVENGHIIATGTAALSWQYRYTLSLIVLDWAGHADALIAPLLAWAKRHQPELFDNPARREQAIRFQVEMLSTSTADIQISIDLTEDVLARPRAGAPAGALNLIHKDEPLPQPWAPWETGMPSQAQQQQEHWEFWIHGDKVAEWDYDPR